MLLLQFGLSMDAVSRSEEGPLNELLHIDTGCWSEWDRCLLLKIGLFS